MESLFCRAGQNRSKVWAKYVMQINRKAFQIGQNTCYVQNVCFKILVLLYRENCKGWKLKNRCPVVWLNSPRSVYIYFIQKRLLNAIICIKRGIKIIVRICIYKTVFGYYVFHLQREKKKVFDCLENRRDIRKVFSNLNANFLCVQNVKLCYIL